MSRVGPEGKPLPYDEKYKILLVGDDGVGTSDILAAYAQDENTGDFAIKVVERGDINIKLQVWDTGQQSCFKTASTSYYKGANGALFIFDATDRETLIALESYAEEAKKYSGTVVEAVVVANRCTPDRVVERADGEAMAGKINAAYAELDTADVDSVARAFDLLIDRLYVPSVAVEEESKVLVPPPPKKKSSKCLLL